MTEREVARRAAPLLARLYRRAQARGLIDAPVVVATADTPATPRADAVSAVPTASSPSTGSARAGRTPPPP